MGEDAPRLGVADDPLRVEEGDGAAREDRLQVAAAELAPQLQLAPRSLHSLTPRSAAVASGAIVVASADSGTELVVTGEGGNWGLEEYLEVKTICGWY